MEGWSWALRGWPPKCLPSSPRPIQVLGVLSVSASTDVESCPRHRQADMPGCVLGACRCPPAGTLTMWRRAARPVSNLPDPKAARWPLPMRASCLASGCPCAGGQRAQQASLPGLHAGAWCLSSAQSMSCLFSQARLLAACPAGFPNIPAPNGDNGPEFSDCARKVGPGRDVSGRLLLFCCAHGLGHRRPD